LILSAVSYNLPVVRNSANESWFLLIWLRRLLPVIVLAAAVGVYCLWSKWITQRQLQEQDRVALVTAQAWIATAKYRNEPERYIQYRDSLLKASGVTREEVFGFLERTGDPPEELLPFARRVQGLVDSLYRIEDSVLKDAERQNRDSAEAAKVQVR
jgi:ABC-type nitrate/sulfonate/bicarbonate transport system substrate-binding protein